jgi:hypothetical protein
MLLNNTGFIAHLIDGLLLEPDHPRQGTDETIKAAVQRDFAECTTACCAFACCAHCAYHSKYLLISLTLLLALTWDVHLALTAPPVLRHSTNCVVSRRA